MQNRSEISSQLNDHKNTKINFKSSKTIDSNKNEKIFLKEKEIFDYKDFDIWSRETNNIETYEGNSNKKDNNNLTEQIKYYVIGCGLAVASFSVFIAKKLN